MRVSEFRVRKATVADGMQHIHLIERKRQIRGHCLHASHQACDRLKRAVDHAGVQDEFTEIVFQPVSNLQPGKSKRIADIDFLNRLERRSIINAKSSALVVIRRSEEHTSELQSPYV